MGKTKLSMKCLSVKRGHLKPSETHRSAPGPRQRRKGRRSQIPKMLCAAQARARQLSMHKALTPTDARSHSCVCAGHSTQPRKKSTRTARGSRSSALFPRRSLSPAPRSKFVYVCGVTLQVTSKTPTQRTLCYVI